MQVDLRALNDEQIHGHGQNCRGGFESLFAHCRKISLRAQDTEQKLFGESCDEMVMVARVSLDGCNPTIDGMALIVRM
jgi:hypothetical protein